jgi:hypothetical protein
MNGIKVSVQAQVHDATNLALSRAQQLLRSLELLCRRRTKSISEPLSHFRAYRQRQKLISSTSSFSEPQGSQPVPPECSSPDFLSFPIALRSITAVGEPEVQSDTNVIDTPGSSPAESEAPKVSDLRSYHLVKLITTRLKRTTTLSRKRLRQIWSRERNGSLTTGEMH